MKKDKNLAVQALILDADRNPIENQKFKLAFNDIVIQGKTGGDGLTKKIYTRTPYDEVQIAVERIDRSTKVIGYVISGYGSKLVTLISPKIKVEGPTLPHPKAPDGQLPLRNAKTIPIYDPKIDQPPTNKKELGAKTEVTATKDGKALIKVSGDIPNLEFLSEYNGEVMEEVDFSWAARELDIEIAAIKAFAEVESKGSGFIKLGPRMFPKILYERHKFARFTQNKYSKMYPDISLPCGYYQLDGRYVIAGSEYKKKRGISDDLNYYRPIGKADDEETVKQAVSFRKLLEERKLTAENHKYLDGLAGYKRLVKAYQLDPDAALKSCSWGAFQIMGEFWDTMKYASVKEFTKAISRSEKEQMKSFVLYMKYVNPKIKNLLRKLDWDGVASAYNGPNYKLNRYDEKLEDAYEKFRGNNG
jgi:hypothetical protein